MIEQTQTFQDLLENEKIEWSHNHFKPLSLDFIDHLKNSKYFSVKQFEKLWPNAWLQIYKLPKGVGKTYDMFRIIKECYNRGEKFIILRWSRNELANFKAEMNHEKQFPFYIQENGNIFNQKEKGVDKKHVGIIGYVKGNGLVPFRSLQFSDYSTVIIDEYVEPPLTSNKKEKETNKEIVRAFVKFLLDVQRAKKDLKCYLFGNSNNLSDPFFDYFKLDYNTNLALDEKAGVLVVQLGGGYYVGSLEKARAMSLLKYDEELELFIKQNKPTDSQRRLLPFSIIRKCDIIAQFVVGSGINNVVCYKLWKPYEYNQFYIVEMSDIIDLNYPTFTNDKRSWVVDKSIQYLPHNNLWWKTLLYKIKFEKIWFIGEMTEKFFTDYLAANCELELLV